MPDKMRAQMVIADAKKHIRRPGRPPKAELERYSERVMVRLDPVTRKALDWRRRQIEKDLGLVEGALDLSTAIRQMLREDAQRHGWIEKDRKVG